MPTDNQIEDIFSSVDKNTKNKAQGNSLMYNNSALEGEKVVVSVGAPTSKKIWLAIGLFLIVAILCGVIYVMIKQFGLFQKTPATTTIEDPQTKQEEVVQPEQKNEAIVEEQAVDDADNDGLTLEEETKLQTNPNKADTDNDGLTDYDEVKTFLTDPLKSDTDGDGYLDGEEVRGGYNPKGAGKLLNFDDAIKQLNNKQ